MFGPFILALPTPFHEDGSIDFDMVNILVKKAETDGHTALVIAGSTGEGHALTQIEKKQLFQYVKKITTLPLLYAISQNNLSLLKQEIENIEKEEPSSYLLTTPYYQKPPQRGVYLFFKEVASYTERPIILYHVPSRTGCTLEFSTMRKLIHQCPNIIGIKDASGDVSLMQLLKKNYPQFLCYTGCDEQFYASLKAGADGIISVMSILYLDEMKQLYQHFKEGYHHVLLDDYLHLISQLLALESNPIPIKYLLQKHGFTSMFLRLPLTELSLEHKKQIDMLL